MNKLTALAALAVFTLAPTMASATTIYCYGGNGDGTYADCAITETPCSTYETSTSCAGDGVSGGACCDSIGVAAPDFDGWPVYQMVDHAIEVNFDNDDDIIDLYASVKGIDSSIVSVKSKLEEYDKAIYSLQSSVKAQAATITKQAESLAALAKLAEAYGSRLDSLDTSIISLKKLDESYGSRLDSLDTTVAAVSALPGISSKLDAQAKKITDLEAKVTE